MQEGRLEVVIIIKYSLVFLASGSNMSLLGGSQLACFKFLFWNNDEKPLIFMIALKKMKRANSIFTSHGGTESKQLQKVLMSQ